MHIELRWSMLNPYTLERSLQFREIEEDEDYPYNYGKWQDVPVVDQE